MALRLAAPEGDTRQQILQRAIALFAGAGYAGVSVRDVAAQVGISAAALYHHFPDKQALYLAAMEHAFARNESGILAAMESALSPLERLDCFVTRFAALVAGDEEFRRLVQRELLDGDEARLELLAEHVFRQPHAAIVALARELAPDLDPYMLADSVIGLVLFSFQTAPLRRHLAGRAEPPESPEDIARHVMTLLTRVFARQDAP
jgi:AcrR family transcriptional regulator